MNFGAITAVALLVSPLLGAQGNVQYRPEAKVYGVEATMAFAPGLVSVRGKNLGLTLEARINGYPVEIVSNTGSRILLRPRAQDPGLAKLELVQPRGAVVAGADFMPSLDARMTDDGMMQVGVHPGMRNFYVMYYSSSLGGSPFIAPAAYYHSMLDLTVPTSGMVRMGASDGTPFGVVAPVPPEMALTPVYLQALCWYTGDGGMFGSYSNVFMLQ